MPDVCIGMNATQKLEKPLTRRELQVMELVAAGKKAPDIGAILGVTAHTAASYRRDALRKLGAIGAPLGAAGMTAPGLSSDAIMIAVELMLAGRGWVDPADGSKWAVVEVSDCILLNDGSLSHPRRVSFRTFADEWKFDA